jgi:hypothetical protein
VADRSADRFSAAEGRATHTARTRVLPLAAIDSVTAAAVGGCLCLTLSRWGPTPRRCLGSSGRRAVERTCNPWRHGIPYGKKPARAGFPTQPGFPIRDGILPTQAASHAHTRARARARAAGASLGGHPHGRGTPLSPSIFAASQYPHLRSRPAQWPWTAGYGRPLRGLDYAGFQLVRPCCDA